MKKDGGFIRTTDRFSGNPIYLNPRFVYMAMPIRDPDDPGVTCKIMMSNGLVKTIEKLPEELEDWGKIE